MLTISREELQAKLASDDQFKLVMVLSDWHFRAMHIPGSIQINQLDEALEMLDKDEEIVVYCTNPVCLSSQYAYRLLVENGYTNVRRYSGGIEEWYAAGLPIEGALADEA